eukprot:Rhum_TRINITY_DN14770_c4_g1::Rhum_TRINITY_DN14770_c4_g1_i1::g.115711::m.115711
MKRSRSSTKLDAQCAICKKWGDSDAQLCTWCSSPRLEQRSGLLHPTDAEQCEYGREWDSEADPPDFPLSTIPVSGTEGFTIHTAIPFDESNKVEFKECGFLNHFPAFNGIFEEPNDYFLPNLPTPGGSDRRWKRQSRAPLPEAVARGGRGRGSGAPPPPQAQTPLLQHAQARAPGKAADRERADCSFHHLLKDLAPSFPDGRWLAKRVPPFYEVLLVENVVSMLNSPSGEDGALYLGVEDADGRVMGMPLTYRQRRSLLYLSGRVLLTVHPPLLRKDVEITFPQVYSDVAKTRPIRNHCLVKVSVHKQPRSPAVPLFVHPRIGRAKYTNKIVWNPFVPQAPVRKLGSKVKLSMEQIKQHLLDTGAVPSLYAALVPGLAAASAAKKHS